MKWGGHLNKVADLLNVRVQEKLAKGGGAGAKKRKEVLF